MPIALSEPANHPQVRAVTNQAPSFWPANLYDADVPLQEAVMRHAGEWGTDRLRDAGAYCGSEEALAHNVRAERNEPILRPYDRHGRRIDEVELDPSWHALMRANVERGVHALPWRDPRPGAHVVRGGLMMLFGQLNGGVQCPISMTHAVIPALREGAPDLSSIWEPQLTALDYDEVKIAGMAMTERQGGSDVRANITRAVPNEDGTYAIWGHKWFCSYPPCNLFLVLAQVGDGGAPSCFLVERGPGMEFQRLKDKLGTRSLASSEVEFHGITGRLVGEVGRGVKAIITMVNHTRLDCLLGSAATMRFGVTQAVHHARHRHAFGDRLDRQPLMQNVLADLAIESEAATAAAVRVAAAYDADEPAFRRFGTAVMKYWVCKRAAAHAAEALECLGGNGYVEDSLMPQLYRDSPLLGIWEGSGNVAALDVLRAMVKEPDGLPAFLGEIELAAGGDARLDAHVEGLKQRLRGLGAPEAAQFQARRIVEDLGTALQGSLLVRHAPSAVADGFCAARLGGEAGRAYGTLPSGVDVRAIIDRALPA